MTETKLDDILQKLWNFGYGDGRGDDDSTLSDKRNYITIEGAKAAIIDLFQEAVPDPGYNQLISDNDNPVDQALDQGWDDCIKLIRTNISKL